MTKVKICGFTRQEDIEDALTLGVDCLGLNFCPKSLRYLNPEEAGKIICSISGNPFFIGVLVNPEQSQVFEIVRRLGLAGIQLHGEETPEFCRRIKEKLPDIMLIKALRLKIKDDLKKIKDYPVDFLLLDTYLKGVPGGTGKRLPLSYLKQADLPLAKIFLAGGITPENVNSFLSIRPYGIDVASGVEKKPGVKDKKKMQELLEKVHTYEANNIYLKDKEQAVIY